MKYFCVDRQSVLSDGLFATKKTEPANASSVLYINPVSKNPFVQQME